MSTEMPIITAKHRKNWTTETFMADWMKQSVTKPSGRRRQK